ncbi:hypothetical protein [Chryseobacterium polytrichastri]|uniref:Uncharacterized protein n=1 Tax=Chryseobacterium polytrichastri TaxID=1302687 RepID=A0A1M6ZSZ5_9FLAO|nr:hypothetical protein [Chryseobacterium polytrichastri]SHL33539.1 hypothetical protein SAMN05444267_101629 [Chryseobacterium polytrichastri]
MKKYTAQLLKNQFILVSENHDEMGRIVHIRKLFFGRHYIILNSRSYDIRNVGFLKNDLELFTAKGVIYFTDLAKERIIKSGGNVRVYYFKLGVTNQLFEKEKLLIEIRTEKKRFKDPVYYLEADDSVDDLLVLLFLHYSTKEFNYIGGDGD